MKTETKKTMPEFNIKAYLETNDYKMKKEALSKWINKDKVFIDRVCFKKTDLEKEICKKAKSDFKKNYLNKGYKPKLITA